MGRFDTSKSALLRNPFSSKNWEVNIRKVLVESCDEQEDPLGYRAVFFLEREAAAAERKKSFAVGASFLAQRERNLTLAGYKAPMTLRAIDMIRKKIGGELPVPDFEALGRAV